MDKIENVIRRIVIPVNLIYPKSVDDQDNDDDGDAMDSEFSLFKQNTIKLLFTQDKFMFEKPHDPPDLLLMQCETD